MKRFILTLSCSDKKGLIAAVTKWVFSLDSNIVNIEQHCEPDSNQLFMRIAFDSPKEKISFEAVAKDFKMEWKITKKEAFPKTLIFVSKQSHCLNALLNKWASNSLPIDVKGIVSNHKALENMANWHDLPFYYHPITKENKKEQEKKALSLIGEHDIDLVILARYMQILSAPFCEKMPGRIINIHHSFLPSFRGAKPYHQAFDKGVKLVGASAHYVTADLDEGPIIEQETARVSHAHTPESLVELGHDIESRVLCRAVHHHATNRILINGQKTVVFN